MIGKMSKDGRYVDTDDGRRIPVASPRPHCYKKLRGYWVMGDVRRHANGREYAGPLTAYTEKQDPFPNPYAI